MHQYLNYRGSRRREKKKGCEKIFEDIVENSPNMEKELVNQVQEVQTAPYRINPRRNMPRHILIKLTKIKHEERILKVARERKQVIYNGKPMCLTAHLSTETLQARREWQDIFKALKGENLQPRLLYPARISLKIDGDIKSCSDKQKVREFTTTNPGLQHVKGTYIVKKYNRRKNIYKFNPKHLRKWQ